jgi:DNA-binding XRE family transcriptional regulator
MERTFAEEIKRIRDSMGLSRKDFANEIGVSATSIQKWEEEGIFPKSSRWRKIKDFTGIDPVTYKVYGEQATQTITRSTISNSPTITAASCGSISINTPPLPGDKHTLALTPQEHEALTLFRRFGNPNLLEKCIQKLKQAEAIFG